MTDPKDKSKKTKNKMKQVMNDTGGHASDQTAMRISLLTLSIILALVAIIILIFGLA